MAKERKAITGSQTTSDRIIELSSRYNLSHIGSCLTAYPIIDEIFKIKKDGEPFVLSEGHAGLALYVILEKYGYGDAETLLNEKGIHPDIIGLGTELPDSEFNLNPIDCSTGSLGQGLPIALGMAICNRDRDVYCLVSDGECMEGSIWEALRLKTDLGVDNLKVYVNCNGLGAYDRIDPIILANRLFSFCPDINIKYTYINSEIRKKYPQLEGLGGHYAKTS